jgi:serine/threonine-protein kinase
MKLPVGHYLQSKKYQLLQVVGQGGFGITYKGLLFTEVKGPLGAIETEVPISIKEYFFKDYCLRAPDGVSVDVHSETGQLLFRKFKEKLIKEARILSEVHHPHIVNVLDVFEENNTAYIAMEYISGYSLKYLLERDGILAEDKVLKYTHQIGEALHFVHEKNILHLDVKPSNILIDKNDNARLIDFGVSKRYDMEDKETSTTMLTLSKGFASIEQYDNEGTLLFSPRPDIYSLGATMYNLLTGKIPTESILRATRSFRKPSELNPSVTRGTERVILKAMQINPADRFATVAEMLAALGKPPVEDQAAPRHQSPPQPDENEDETLLYAPAQAPVRERPKKKRRKELLIVTLICIFVAVGASVVMLVDKDDHSASVSDTILLPPESPAAEETAGEPAATETANAERENTAPPIIETPPIADMREKLPPVEKPDTDGVNIELSTVSQLTAEEATAEYEALLASGKEKMNIGNNIEAEEDFLKAMSLNPSNEAAKQLFRLNASQIEEKRVEERIALYEEKTSFGKYKIVRKKSTNKYGAINEKGEEVILCRYKQADVADEGWAFEREDKLFDIYDTNGELIRSDVRY